MQNNYPINNLKWFMGIFVYFVLFSFIFPRIAVELTLLENPSAAYIPVKYQFLMYFVALLPLLYISWPLLKMEKTKDLKSILTTVLFSVLILLIMNMVFNIIINFFQKPIVSNNQAALNTIRLDSKVLFIGMSVVVGPFVEEIVFRGLIFRKIYDGSHFISAMLISSFLFGFVHIMDSVLNGDFSQVMYLFLYGGLGTIFCFVYRRHNTIYVCILLHMVYNFLANASFIFS